SPDYSLRPKGENILTLEATDSSKVAYHARFYITLDEHATGPALTRLSRGNTPQVAAPAVKEPPTIKFTSTWPARTSDTSVLLTAEVSDADGLIRIVIEVNGKDVEEIQLQNERPLRKREGFIARGALPGDVTGDSRRIVLSIPVALGKNISVV